MMYEAAKRWAKSQSRLYHNAQYIVHTMDEGYQVANQFTMDTWFAGENALESYWDGEQDE